MTFTVVSNSTYLFSWFIFYINVKSQVSLSPNNVLLGSLGLSGRSRDRIPYQATEYFSCPLDMFIVILFPYLAVWPPYGSEGLS